MTGLQWEKRMKGQTYTSTGRTTSSQESDHAGKRQAFKVPAPADNSQKRLGQFSQYQNSFCCLSAWFAVPLSALSGCHRLQENQSIIE